MKPHILPTKARERNPQTLCAAVGFADGIGGIQSQNIVGYNTVTVNKEWSIFAVNFKTTSDSNLTIQEAFPYVEGMTKGNASSGDQIQIQKPEGDGYDTFFLSDGNFKKMGKNNYDPAKDGKWFVSSATAASSSSDFALAPGQAFWYLSKRFVNNPEAEPFSMTIAGMIPGDASKDITVDKEWKHIANPYPFDLPISSLTYVEGMTKGNASNGDQIQVQKPDGEGYDTFFLSDGNFKKMGKDNYDPAKDGKWFVNSATTASSPTDAVIPVGKGAWYRRMGDKEFTFTIDSPIK